MELGFQIAAPPCMTVQLSPRASFYSLTFVVKFLWICVIVVFKLKQGTSSIQIKTFITRRRGFDLSHLMQLGNCFARSFAERNQTVNDRKAVLLENLTHAINTLENQF